MSVDWLYCVRARDPFGLTTTCPLMGFPGAQMVKNPPAVQETWVRFLGWEDPLEKGTSTHSSTLAWRIPWTEEHVYWEINTSLVLIIVLLCHGPSHCEVSYLGISSVQFSSVQSLSRA